MPTESPRPFLVPLRTPGPTAVSEFPEGMSRVPTGVPDFDYLTGGLPSGAVVLLFGEAGSGHQEFALTSAVHLMLHYDDPRLHRFYLGNAKGPFVYPQGIVYVSTSRSREQVLAELNASFEETYSEVLARHLNFHDLSPSYFQDTVVPSTWASLSSPLLSGAPVSAAPDDGGPLRALADAVDQDGRKNLVIVDSLTDLLVRRGVEPSDIVTLLKGLRQPGERMGRRRLPPPLERSGPRGGGTGGDRLGGRGPALQLGIEPESGAPATGDADRQVHADPLSPSRRVPRSVHDTGERGERIGDDAI